MVRDQFLTKLGNCGVKRVETLGVPFNPNQHEAISMVPVADPEQDGTVVAVITEGYTINGEVLRAAVVAVGQCAAPADEPADEPADDVDTPNDTTQEDDG
jgi:molecular chaperone GrpE